MDLLKRPMTPEQQENVMASFWIMLREAESRADSSNDQLLQKWVEGWYRQWNELTGSNLKPVWIVRQQTVSALWIEA